VGAVLFVRDRLSINARCSGFRPFSFPSGEIESLLKQFVPLEIQIMEKAIADVLFGFFFGLGFALAGAVISFIGAIISRGYPPRT